MSFIRGAVLTKGLASPFIQTTAVHVGSVGPDSQPIIAKSARLTIRSDEAARRTISDTDGTARRARQIAENNRLI